MRWPMPPKAVMNRAEFSRWSGIAYNTIRAHEMAGLIEPLRYRGRPFYTADHLTILIKHGVVRSHRPG